MEQTKHMLSCLIKFHIKPVLSTLWLLLGQTQRLCTNGILICMLVSNNVLLKCSSECSFLLPSHEISIALNRSLPSCHYQAEREQHTEQKAIKTLMHAGSAQCILEGCVISINT